jgi:hypothetical protein
MKRIFCLLAAACFFACATQLQATPTLVGGSPMVVNNTSSNCTAAVTFISPPTIQPFSVTHGVLINTNDISISVSNTLDNVNFTYAYTWHPLSIAATTEYIGTAPVTNYCRATVTTTNSQSVIINYGL